MPDPYRETQHQGRYGHQLGCTGFSFTYTGRVLEPGNFDDPAGLNMYSQELRERETSNGRHAVVAAIAVNAVEPPNGLDATELLGVCGLTSISDVRSLGMHMKILPGEKKIDGFSMFQLERASV